MFTEREKAPLKFLKFYQYVSLPLGTIVILVEMILSFASTDIEMVVGGVILAIFYYIPFITISIIAFIGLIKWSIAGYTCVLIRQWGNVVYCLVILIVSADASSATQLVIAIAWAIGLTIYLKHRKKLFNPYYNTLNYGGIPNGFNQGNSAYATNAVNTVDEIKTTIVKPQFCRKCGKRLSGESNYCRYCGTSVYFNQ